MFKFIENNIKQNLKGICTLLVVTSLFLLPDFTEARGGGFGGSRGGGGGRSFGRSSSRSFSAPKQSFGGSRSMSAPRSSSVASTRSASFGGTRMESGSAYRAQYGVPRQSTPMVGRDNFGHPTNYIVHSYGGGYGSGLMTGYMMGRTSWMWYTPFHPAFYYSQPYYAPMPNGGMEVYPPTFSFSKFLFTLMLFALVLYIIVRIVRAARGGGNQLNSHSQSSFG